MLCLHIVAIREIHTAARVAVGLDVFGDADIDRHVAHRDRTDGIDMTLGSNGTLRRRDPGVVHNLRLVVGDADDDGAERDPLRASVSAKRRRDPCLYVQRVV